jgi:signal transduction histidine kinase
MRHDGRVPPALEQPLRGATRTFLFADLLRGPRPDQDRSRRSGKGPVAVNAPAGRPSVTLGTTRLTYLRQPDKPPAIGAIRPTRRLTTEFLRLALVALTYYLAARLSLNLALVHGQVTPVWPPTGIALVAFLVIGRRAWPAIALAAFAVNLPIGPSPLGAAMIAAGNTLAPLVAAEFLRRVGFHVQLDRLRDATAIIGIAALGGMAISATIGSSVLVLFGAVPPNEFWVSWAVWWTGDAMGILLVAPFLLGLLVRPRPPALGWRARLELAGLLAGTAVVTLVLFQSRLRLEYLVLPLIMATAWRFRLRGAAPAALIASGVAIWSAIQGIGPFAGETLFEKMVALQAFNVSVALASFVLASFVNTRERQEETSRLYESAKLASQAKTRFLHLAAHELRTPITVLTGYLSLLSEGTLGTIPDGWKKALEILSAKTWELNRIVADLLEASRIDANVKPRNHNQVDLRKVVQDAGERARPRADLLAAEVAVRLTDEPVQVEGDAEQLGRILDNLINNGLTYSVRSPRLSITVSGEGNRAIVRVADNGAGIPDEERERIFEQFHRSNEPAFRNVPGTGLGLYISRELAEGHGGSLVVESSAPDRGSVFTLALPLSMPASTRAPAAAGDPGQASAKSEAPTEALTRA